MSKKISELTAATDPTGSEKFEVTQSSTSKAMSAQQIAKATLAVTASGTNTYTATPSPALTAYTTNDRFYVKFTNANTGASTINLNSLGAKDIKKSGTSALSSGDIAAGQIVELVYDGTNFQIVGGGGGSGSGTIGGSTGSTDNRIIRADGGGGATIQSSSATLSDSGGITLGAGTSGAGTAPLYFQSGTSMSSPENGAVEYNGTNVHLTTGGTRYILPRVLMVKASLNFGSTAAQSSSDLTATVTGAAVDDAVFLGVDGTVNANTCYTAWVSASNTVTVRFNNYSSGSIDPALTTFTIMVGKWS